MRGCELTRGQQTSRWGTTWRRASGSTSPGLSPATCTGHLVFRGETGEPLGLLLTKVSGAQRCTHGRPREEITFSDMQTTLGDTES